MALIRHAEVPGVGDPDGFRIDDCSTQRNLSAAGRAQAVRVGRAFPKRGIRVSRVLASRWCRCIETAQLAFDRYEPLPALDSLHGRRERAAQQTAEVGALLAEAPRDGVLVLVTHQANISALAGGAGARSGEILVAPLRADGVVEIAARLAPP